MLNGLARNRLELSITRAIIIVIGLRVGYEPNKKYRPVEPYSARTVTLLNQPRTVKKPI